MSDPARPEHDGGTSIQTYAVAREVIPATRPAWLADEPSRRHGSSAPESAAPEGAAIERTMRAAAEGRHVPLPALSPSAVIHLQRTIGNAGVARLLVQRCAPGEVPDEGCAECGQPPVAQRVVQRATVQREPIDQPPAETAVTEPAGSGGATPTGEGHRPASR